MFAVRIVSADAQMSTTNTSPITIDGDYDDWSGAKKTSSITGYTSSVVTNGKYIYMHINTTSQWYIPSTGYLVKVGNALYRLTFDDLQQKQVNGQTTAFSVSAATEGWQSLGTVGDGEITYNSKWDASQNANVI
ncbi:hypothetical protein [Pediococcus cellicola]|uniref:Uncharacterized protein n=2 Tax=Pediococcus cellicola TaxID=319652 RepID=A0A0R2INY9_9LACO|nr:hypothetical protein [Pediococcus cellicola]KRN66883.1 hypothetical protein IV80_GL000972 [Pediococcus cellicola]